MADFAVASIASLNKKHGITLLKFLCQVLNHGNQRFNFLSLATSLMLFHSGARKKVLNIVHSVGGGVS